MARGCTIAMPQGCPVVVSGDEARVSGGVGVVRRQRAGQGVNNSTARGNQPDQGAWLLRWDKSRARARRISPRQQQIFVV
jgi:hypothetical protein